jgi:hypothetical protein
MNTEGTHLSVRISSDTLSKIDAMAKVSGHSRSSIVRWVLGSARLDHLPRVRIEERDATKELDHVNAS